MKKIVLLLVAFGLVIVMTVPALAVHPLLDVAFEIVWGEVVEYDADVILVLTDQGGSAIEGWDNIPLVPGGEFEWWTEQLVNVPDEAVGYKIDWNSGAGIEWSPEPPPIYGDIDWINELIFDFTQASNR